MKMWKIVPVTGIIAGLLQVGGTGQAAGSINDETAYVTTRVTEIVYDTHGRYVAKHTTGEMNAAGQSYEVQNPYVSTAHALTGCHQVQVSTTGHSLLGFIMFRYWVWTHSCWNTRQRLVYDVWNGRAFTRVDGVHQVDATLTVYRHHFFNPTSGWDPYPVPGLTDHSAYYHLSKGEVHGPCLSGITCYYRPWGSVRSYYDGEWMVKSGGNEEDPITKTG